MDNLDRTVYNFRDWRPNDYILVVDIFNDFKLCSLCKGTIKNYYWAALHYNKNICTICWPKEKNSET